MIVTWPESVITQYLSESNLILAMHASSMLLRNLEFVKGVFLKKKKITSNQRFLIGIISVGYSEAFMYQTE